MQLARVRYQIKSHQMKFDFSLEAVTSLTEDEDEEVVRKYGKGDEHKDMVSKFIDILVSRRGFGVSDPRDMIFAHSGLVQNLNIGNPNYNHSIAQVFESLARHQMSSMRNYEIFSYVETIESHERQHGLPSWVPDWTRANPSSPGRIMQHAGKEYFKDTTPLPRPHLGRWLDFRDCPLEDLGPGLLWNVGYVTHNVKDISNVLDETDTTDFSSDMWESFTRPFHFNLDVEKLYKRWQTRLGSKSYMMSGWYGSMNPLEESATAAAFRAALKTPNFMAQSPISHLLRCYHKDRPAAGIVGGRRLARVQEIGDDLILPKLAFVPATACIDDKVCFFRSCPVPFLLRKMPSVGTTDVAGREALDILESKVRVLAEQEGTIPLRGRRLGRPPVSKSLDRPERWEVEQFRLLGECFVEGYMYGAAKDLPDIFYYKMPSLIVLH